MLSLIQSQYECSLIRPSRSLREALFTFLMYL